MSVMLLGSSFVTAVLIPPEAFQPGGPADGRALAYLAHERFGPAFGTLYDVEHDRHSLVRRRVGARGAPESRAALPAAVRHGARVGAREPAARHHHHRHQHRGDAGLPRGRRGAGRRVRHRRAGADELGRARGGDQRLAPGGALGALLRDRRGVLLHDRSPTWWSGPKGIKIASLFILGIVISSLVSRTLRSTELRVHGFVLDETASKFIEEADRSESIRIIANRPDDGSVREYDDKVREARNSHHLTLDDSVLFLEVRPGDASQFTDVLKVEGVQVGPYRVLRCQSPAIPNAIAALLLHIRDTTGHLPHVYFGWTEGNPITYVLEVPGVRRGRHRAGDARGAPQVRARSAPPSARARRLMPCRWNCRMQIVDFRLIADCRLGDGVLNSPI